MTSRWPFPADTATQRARRIALSYRAHLHSVAPELCAELDAAAAEFGETWLVPTPRFEVSDFLSAREVADYLCVTVGAVRKARERGSLKGWRCGARLDWQYLFRDVLDYERLGGRRGEAKEEG